MGMAAAASGLYGNRRPFPVPALRLALCELRPKNYIVCIPRQLFRASICSRSSAVNSGKGGQVGRERVNCLYTEEPDEEDQEEDNFELLFQIASNIIRRISKHAAKFAIDLLPPMISSQLVKFSINGVVMLGFLWILKAMLELTCVVGSIIFIGILLIRGMWAIMCYFHLYHSDNVDSNGKVYGHLRTKFS